MFRVSQYLSAPLVPPLIIMIRAARSAPPKPPPRKQLTRHVCIATIALRLCRWRVSSKPLCRQRRFNDRLLPACRAEIAVEPIGKSPDVPNHAPPAMTAARVDDQLDIAAQFLRPSREPLRLVER